MANLETIELTISGSAEQAQQGINQLITSLGSLSDALAKPYSDLRDLCAVLKDISGYCKSIKLPSIGKVTGATNAVAKAKQAVQSYDMEHNNGRGFIAPKPTEDSYKKDIEWSKQLRINLDKAKASAPTKAWNINRRQELAKEGYPYNKPTGAKEVANANKNVAETAKQASEATKEQTENTKELKKESEDTPSALKGLKQGLKSLTSGISGFFSKVKRIATTMLIRAAIRGLIKSMKEGVNNLYEWSKLNNGAFAKSLDTIKNKAGELKNSLGAAIAPVIQAAIPVIQSLMSAAIDAFNWVNQLISLLSGKSSWTKATEGVHDYTDATKKASGANKEWLASFDELNVMTSGGGGGGSGKTQVDYSDMFEEVDSFDSDIREIVEFIKENMEMIKKIAIETGAAIVAWKLGNSFMEALPVLSTLMGYVATGAAIVVTIGLEWLFANQYLKTGKEGWLWAEVLTGAVGSIAAWGIANKLIGGTAGAWAATITLAFTAITGIVALIGDTDVSAFSAEAIKQNIVSSLSMGAAVGIGLKMIAGVSGGWALVAAGAAALVTFGVVVGLKVLTQKNKVSVDPNLITLSREQCQAYAKSKMFTIDPDIMVNVIKDQITLSENAEQQVRDALTGMLGTQHVIKLGLADDDDYIEIKNQITGEGGLIDKINGWINEAEATSKLVLKFTPQLVGETPEEQQQWYLDNSKGWDAVKGFMNDIGKKLTDEIVEGEKGELIIKRPERVAALLDEAARISEIIAGTDVSTELNIDFSLGLENYDSSSVGQVIADFYEYKEKMSAAAEELRETAYTNQARLVEALKYMLTIDPNNSEIKQRLAEAEAGLEEIKSNWQEGVDKAVDEMTAPGRQILQEWMKNNIFTEHEKGSIDFPVDFKVQLRMEEEISTKFQNLLQDEVDNAVDVMQYAFRTAGIDIPTEFIGDFLKFGGWDLLGEDLQKKIMSYVSITPNTIGKLKEKLGMDASQIIKFTNYNKLEQREQQEFIASLVRAYGSESISAIKKQLPSITVTDIIKVSNWDKFKTSQKIEFLTAIAQAYGAEETKKAAKNCGIDIVEEIKKGLGSNNESVKKQAQELNKILKTNIENPSPQPKVQVQEDKSKTTSTIASITGALGVFKPNVNVQENRQNTNSVVGVINGALGVFKPSVNVQENRSNTNNVRSIINSALGSFNPNVNVQENRSQTNSTKNIIIGALGVFAPLVNAQENRNATNKAKSGISSTIVSFNPSVNATENKNSTNNAKSSIYSTLGSVTTHVNVGVNDKTMQEARKGIVSSLGSPFSVKVNANLNNSAAFKSSVAGALNGIKLTISGGSGNSKQFAKVTAVAASGGLFNSGDVFIANENGTGEMIGRFGNQTGVANQREIVAGIQKGVADANAEQNALLRQQNNLLRALLEKDSTVHIGASSEMGRVVSRSLGMYNAMVGG